MLSFSLKIYWWAVFMKPIVICETTEYTAFLYVNNLKTKFEKLG